MTPDSDVSRVVSRLRSELEALRGRVYRKAAKDAGVATAQPFWEHKAIALTTPLATTYGTATWQYAFVPAGSNEYIQWRTATLSGEFAYASDGFTSGSYHRLVWNSEHVYRAKALIHRTEDGVTSGNLQMIFNGVLTNIALASYYAATLDVQRGLNELVLMRDFEPYSVQLTGELFTP